MVRKYIGQQAIDRNYRLLAGNDTLTHIKYVRYLS